VTPDTFTRLYRLHYRALWLQAAAWGVPWDECGDLAHEAFLRAWQTGQEPEGDGGGWLWVIARNLLSDDRRKWLARGRRVNYDIMLDTHAVEDDPDDRVQAELCLARLDPRDRRVVEMFAAGYDGYEIAPLVGLAAKNVYAHYDAAIDYLGGRRERPIRWGKGRPRKDEQWTPAA